MGYTLAIGELTIDADSDSENMLCTLIEHNVKGESHDNAPAYGEPTDFTNARWPSYTAWADFADFTGLRSLFFSKDYGLMRKHPGVFPINQAHKDAIAEAYEEFKKKYPNAKPGYSPKVKDIFADPDPSWPKENEAMVRLEWLTYWVDWALKNCIMPVFYNS